MILEYKTTEKSLAHGKGKRNMTFVREIFYIMVYVAIGVVINHMVHGPLSYSDVLDMSLVILWPIYLVPLILFIVISVVIAIFVWAFIITLQKVAKRKTTNTADRTKKSEKSKGSNYDINV